MLALAQVVAGCRGDSCVEENTLIATPRGDRAIAEVQVGDSIWSVAPESGAKTLGRVSRVVRAWGWCEKLHLSRESLWVTAEHPLYSPELGEFRTAQHWLRGELGTTLGADGLPMSTEPGAWYEQRPCRVIDLTVEADPHTFIAAGIVVHNKEPVPDDSCVADSDCFGSFICIDDFCTFPECRDADECDADEVCSSGRCETESGGGGSGGAGGSGGGGAGGSGGGGAGGEGGAGGAGDPVSI